MERNDFGAMVGGIMDLAGMPRRVADHPDAFADWNYISSIGSYISALGLIAFGADGRELSRIHSRTQHPRDKRREASAHGAAYRSTSARLFFVLRADVASASRTAGSGAGSSAAGSILVSVSWRRKSAERPA